MDDFLDDILDAMDEVDETAGVKFQIGRDQVLCNWTGAEEGLELTIRGGQVEKLRGTLVVSRRRLKERPQLLSIITGPDQIRYRIARATPDGASWTLLLTDPNGNGNR